MRRRIVGIMVIFLLLLTACGQGENIPETEGEARDYMAEYRNQKQVDPKHITWKAEGVEPAEIVYQAESFQTPVFRNAEGRNWDMGSVICDNIYARMYMKDYYGDDSEMEVFTYYVDKLNADTFETESVTYFFVKGESRPVEFDYAGGNYYGMLEHFDEQFLVDQVCVTVMLSDGTLGESIDITTALKELGLLPEREHFAFQCQFHVNPSEGLIYIVPYEKNGLYVLNMEGILQYQYAGETDGSSISIWANTASEDSIFASFNSLKGEITFFCFADDGVKELLTKPGSIDNLASIDPYGNVLYLENRTNLVNWNIYTGKQEKVVSGVVDMKREPAGVLRNREGKIIVLRDDTYGLSLNVYSLGGPKVQTEITIETTEGWGLDLPDKLRKFEQAHPGITIKCGSEALDCASQTIRLNQLYSDICAGKGPDLVYLPYFQVEKFLTGEVLLAMSDAVDKEEGKVLQGFLDIGRYEGEQYYFPMNFFNETVVVKKSVWDKSTWTVQEVLELWEEKKKMNPGYLLFDGEYTTCQNLLHFFVNDIANSPFIDTNTMTASFDSALFRKVLECCKEQTAIAERKAKAGELPESSVVAMQKDEQLADTCYPLFNLYSEIIADLDEDINFVGYPTEGDSGNLGLGNYGFVINHSTEHADIIAELLQYLYSYDACKSNNFSMPFRTDVLDLNP